MKSDYSARRLLTNHPEQSIVPLRLAMLTATELQHRAQDYKHSVDMPGGLPWDGETARAVQDTAASDEKTIYLATQVLPGGRGAFGYLAVSLAKGGPHWVSGDRGAAGWQPGDPQATSTPLLAPGPTSTVATPQVT